MKFHLTIILFCVFQTSFSQDSTSIDMSELSVTANIINTEIKNVGRNITVIDRKMIENSPVKTLDGVLQYALNVDVRSRSAFGVQADISIRGGHYDQTLILVDGIKVNDPQTGHHSLNIPVPFSMIDRIEILQGGTSRVFGPSAFSGVINIITKKISENLVSANLGMGSYGSKNAAINTGLIFKQNTASVSLEHLDSDGYIKNTAFKKQSISATLGRIYSKGSLDLNFGAMANQFGASNFYHPKFYKQYEEVDSRLVNLSWKHKFGRKLSGILMINQRKHHDLYDFDDYLGSKKFSSVNFHITSVFDAEWKFKLDNNLGQTAFGAEYRIEKVLSNRLGDNLAEPQVVDAELFPNVFYNKSKTRDNFSFFGEHQKRWNKFNLSAGTLANYNSQFGLAFYPGIDLSYFSSQNASFYASANRSLRYPTFTELYLNTSTVKADPNLKPEKAMSFEVGHKYQSKMYSSVFSVFYRKTTDAIDKVKRPELNVPTMENIDDINMFGIELSQQILLDNYVKFLKKLSFNYAFLKADRNEDGFQSFYTLNYLKQKFSAGLFLQPIKNSSLAIWYTHKNRAGNYQWDAVSPLLAYPKVNLLDIRLSQQIGKITLFVDANNVFDRTYFEHGFVQLPGRWITAGIKADF
jgi:iron complex outermembrane receptor protein